MSNFACILTFHKSKLRQSIAGAGMRQMRCYGRSLLLQACVGALMITTASALDYSTLIQSIEPSRAARYEQFAGFQIKGICGTARLNLAAEYGANTIRTYTPPTKTELDKYQQLGFKVIAGIWMPHQGENKGTGGNWDFDYQTQADGLFTNFVKTVESIGDHPAILMWCLGNEVPLDQRYLETVNRMSLTLHQKHPKQLTSLTMVNAPKEKIALIKQYAPDLDVIGYNSYGQGAVSTSSQNLEREWGQAYYVSEFGPQGPWWGRKTAWGEFYEQSYDQKLEDLRRSFKTIDAAPHCLGSTMFLWGCWTQTKPTYFSAFLSPLGTVKNVVDQDLFPTPMSEEFCHYWSGKYPIERAPILTKINIEGQKDKSDVVVQAGHSFKATATATNPLTPAPKMQYRWWILNSKGNAVIGPINTDIPTVELKVPSNAEENYFVMAYVIAENHLASGFTMPIKVNNDKGKARSANSIEVAEKSKQM